MHRDDHHWTEEEDYTCCKLYLKYFAYKSFSSLSFEGFVDILKNRLPDDITRDSIGMKIRTIKQLCIEYGIDDCLTSSLSNYSSQSKRMFKKALQRLNSGHLFDDEDELDGYPDKSLLSHSRQQKKHDVFSPSQWKDSYDSEYNGTRPEYKNNYSTSSSAMEMLIIGSCIIAGVALVGSLLYGLYYVIVYMVYPNLLKMLQIIYDNKWYVLIGIIALIVGGYILWIVLKILFEVLQKVLEFLAEIFVFIMKILFQITKYGCIVLFIVGCIYVAYEYIQAPDDMKPLDFVYNLKYKSDNIINSLSKDDVEATDESTVDAETAQESNAGNEANSENSADNATVQENNEDTKVIPVDIPIEDML